MNLRSQGWLVSFCFACSIFLITSCGGGGGGDDGPTIPASYDGLTTQAAITTANAEELVLGAWDGGLPADNAGDVISLATKSSVPDSSSPLVTDILKNTVLDLYSETQNNIHPLATASDTMAGDCGGTASFFLTVNEDNGSFTGKLTFTDYCSDGVVINGITPFSGRASTSDGEIVYLKMIFDDLNAIDGTTSQTLTDGSISFSLNSTRTIETETINYVLVDDSLAKACWINNYVLVFNLDTGSSTLTGRFYHPDYGYINISTLTPMTTSGTTLPTSGVLLFTGQTSQAKLTFNSDETTLLEVDDNNDGVFEEYGQVDLGFISENITIIVDPPIEPPPEL